MFFLLIFFPFTSHILLSSTANIVLPPFTESSFYLRAPQNRSALARQFTRLGKSVGLRLHFSPGTLANPSSALKKRNNAGYEKKVQKKYVTKG